MATPLYIKMKDKGTSFYAFPSAASDLNTYFLNDNFKINFSKFILLNIPEQDIVIKSGIQRDQTDGVLNFDKSQNGPNFYNFQPGGNSDLPIKFSEQLIESLRNYIANYDTSLRESRINSNTDFFNVNETASPTEMIFWKWAKKLNLIDLEPAVHKVDWDKNLSDFINKNGSDYNFFNKYLWKERETYYYNSEITQSSGNKPLLTINQNVKFKKGDKILLSGDTGSYLTTGETYTIESISINNNVSEIILDYTGYLGGIQSDVTVYLNYHKFIKYIGEIQAVSKVQTSKQNFTEVIANIPHHCGVTPTILFETFNNKNYYPDLEMPILPIEQQEEIIGSENLNSPIRINPQDYPGTYYGYFDTYDKTYKCTTGDKLRYKGEYYGILLNNNIEVNTDDYFEKLDDFNSNNIDGLKLDFNRNHYLKMNLPNKQINNFDEFNSAYFDTSPEDFEFNAILWYYEVDDGSGNIKTNLYGIEFLNNPNDDKDDCDINDKLITTYKKRVSNNYQDGNSYMFSLDVLYGIDNGELPLNYDSTTLQNMFGFDLYQNVLESNYKLNDNFLNIISSFTYINDELQKLRSMIYSQTDIDYLKNQINNFNELLQLYSTYQFKDSDTIKIETDFTGSYPMLKFNTIDTYYGDIQNINISDVYDFSSNNSGISYIVNIPYSKSLLINIYNDNNDIVDNEANIVLNKDLLYKQNIEIYITPNTASLINNLNINILFNDSIQVTEQNLINIQLPIDIISYDTFNPTGSTYYKSHYNNDNIQTHSNAMVSGVTLTELNIFEDIFDENDIIYINNFYLEDINTNEIKDYSGVYNISAHTSYLNLGTIIINLNTEDKELISIPEISYYKGWKINILRINDTLLSDVNERYKITKELL